MFQSVFVPSSRTAWVDLMLPFATIIVVLLLLAAGG